MDYRNMDETKQAQEIVYQLRNPDVLRKVIEMMKISDPVGITQIKKHLELKKVIDKLKQYRLSHEGESDIIVDKEYYAERIKSEYTIGEITIDYDDLIRELRL